jgi:hypothetical protein
VVLINYEVEPKKSLPAAVTDVPHAELAKFALRYLVVCVLGGLCVR